MRCAPCLRREPANRRGETASSQNAHALALEPPRRVELPSDGLRDRCITVVLRGRRGSSDPPESVSDVESEPHRAGDRSRTGLDLCGAQTCHLDTPAWWCCGNRAPSVGRSRRQRVLRSRSRRVGPVGFEPTFFLGKNQVQSSFATDPSGPTLWNRTRTSRASAKRADQLRKSGIRVLCARVGNAHAQHQIIIIIVFSCQRSVGRPVGAYARRTSGLDAVAVTASAPLAIRDLHSDIESQHR